jgi:hypothetical protein
MIGTFVAPGHSPLRILTVTSFAELLVLLHAGLCLLSRRHSAGAGILIKLTLTCLAKTSAEAAWSFLRKGCHLDVR